MSLINTAWYVGSVQYAAISVWTAAQTWSVGQLRRQVSPAVGSERIFVCVVAGAGHATTEPTWVLTKGAKTTDNAATWMECTAMPALNKDSASTQPWQAGNGTALGRIIKNVSGGADTYFICTTSSGNTGGTEPTWNKTTGATTADGSNVWTSLGAISSMTAWGAPSARLGNIQGSSWATAGDSIYVSDNHAETQAAALTISLQGSTSAPCKVFCGDRTGSLPPATADLKTTASIATTGASNLLVSTAANGVNTISGVQFSAGDSSNNASVTIGANASLTTLESCKLTLNNTNASASIAFGGAIVELINTPMVFGATGQRIVLSGTTIFNWKNTPSAISGTGPTNLFSGGNSGFTLITCSGVDLSFLSTGKTLLFGSGSAVNITRLINCKLGASVALGGNGSVARDTIWLVNCDSGATTYRNEFHSVCGDMVTTTVNTRTGGATDGTTAIAHKLSLSSSANPQNPLESFEMAVWNSSVGSAKTVSINFMADDPSALTNRDIWMDIEYLGDSGSPLSTILSTRSDLLPSTTPTAWGADVTSTWVTTAIGTPQKQTMSASITPQEVGWIKVKVKVGKPSAIVVIDSVVLVT